MLQGDYAAWSYLAAIRPLVLESDPTASGTETFSGGMQNGSPLPPVTFPYGPTATFRCVAGTQVITGRGASPVTLTTTTLCSRDWNFIQSFAPIGTRLNLRTRHKLQPTLSSSLGYMFATHPIPTDEGGSFNFVFDFGAGVELYRAAHRSIRLEYLVQHFSNKGTALINPGVDNGIFRLTYCLGH